MQEAFDSSNPLITLSESHRRLSLRALEFVLIAWAISMAIGSALVEWAYWWALIITDMLGPCIASAIYRSKSRKYSESEPRNEKTAQEAYSAAKNNFYKIISGIIYANCLTLIFCYNQWMAFAAFVLWMVLFLQIPKAAEIQRDFAYEDDREPDFF